MSRALISSSISNARRSTSISVGFHQRSQTALSEPGRRGTTDGAENERPACPLAPELAIDTEIRPHARAEGCHCGSSGHFYLQSLRPQRYDETVFQSYSEHRQRARRGEYPAVRHLRRATTHKRSCRRGYTGVDPFSWTYDPLVERSPRCRVHKSGIRPSSRGRWWSLSGLAEHQTSWPGSSSPQLSLSVTG